MFTSKFSQTRNSMHTFSRAPLAKGQKWLDQATAPAGHNLSFENVRANFIPIISSIAERDAYFLMVKNNKRIVGGERGNEFTNVIRFLDRYKIKEIPNTNSESYVIVDENDNYMTDFIDPADRPIAQYSLSEGYELLMFSADGERISRNVGWTFDSFNGIIHFENKNPKSPDWEYGEVTVEGFIYIGEKISNIMNSLDQNVENAMQEMKAAENAAISIQPYRFSTSEMTRIGNPYPLANSHWPDLDYFQCLSIVIPGYVFELTSLDKDETILTEMRHLPTGDTQIFLNIPWHVEYNQPIMSYSYDSGQDGIGNRIPLLGRYRFSAVSFKAKDGSNIPLKPVIDLTRNDVTPVPLGYELSTPWEAGIPVDPTTMPPHPQYSCGYHGGYHSDDDTIVNVYNTYQN